MIIVNLIIIYLQLSFQTISKLTLQKINKTTDETMTTYRYLLLWIVRLIHDDPNLMLHVSHIY